MAKSTSKNAMPQKNSPKERTFLQEPMGPAGSVADDANSPFADPLSKFGPADTSTFDTTARAYFSADPKERTRNQTLAMFESALSAYFEANESKISSILERFDRRAKKISSVAQQSEDHIGQIILRLEDLSRQVGDPATALEGFKASIAESLKLQEARKLWGASEVRARQAYIASWGILVLLLVIAPAIAIYRADAVFSFLRAVGDAVVVDLPADPSETVVLITAVSRLVLVTLPVALFIWLIRIVVRFNMRSLLLMDDANQRSTMLETYLHLVEQDAAVKADRPLILEALFRRTPGHGADTIEPPNLTDILRIGTPNVTK